MNDAGKMVAAITNWPGDDEGNAHLIAAAPDLLAAVEFAQEFFDSLPSGWLGKVSGDIGAINEFFLVAGPALKKAKGVG